MFTVIIFTDGRNDYLEQTLSTFFDQVRFPSPPHTLLVDDMPTGRDQSALRRIARRFNLDRVFLNETNLGQFATVTYAWRQVPAETRYIFHLENDFVFPDPIDVAQLQAIVDSPTIANVTLLRQPWYADERAAGSLLRVRPERFRETWIRGIPVCLHQDYFGFNPGLYRREIALALSAPAIKEGEREPWLEEVLRQAILADQPELEFAVLGHRQDPPRVLHIGHRRVGRSPDHGGPGPDPTDLGGRPFTPAPLAPSQGPGPTILLYHRIAALDPDPSGICVPPEIFRLQMEQVAKQFEPLDLLTLIRQHKRGVVASDAVAITIDDAYADALVASEILTRLRIPVTLFATSLGGELIHDTIARTIFNPNLDTFGPIDVSVDGSRLDIADPASDPTKTFHALNNFVWRLSDGGRRRLLAYLQDWSEIDLAPRETHRLMTPAELRRFASQPGHRVGAHTVNHLFLPSQSRATKAFELTENVEYLRAVTRSDIETVAYPYGGADAGTASVCRGLGLEVAVTASGGHIARSSDCLFLPRREVRSAQLGSVLGSGRS